MMKKNMALEMIKNAMALSSPEFIDDTRNLLTLILQNSSYPIYFINDLFNATKDVKPAKNDFLKQIPLRYVSCPYYDPLLNSMVKMITTSNPRLRLAPKPSSNNKRILYTKLKDVHERSTLKNSIFKLSCKNCNFTQIATTKNSDIHRSIERIFSDITSPSSQHRSEFPNHILDEKPTIIKTFHNKYDLEHSEYILNILKDKYQPDIL